MLHITTTAVDIIRDHSAESSTKTSDKRVDPNILGNKGDLHIPGPQLSTSVFNIIYKNN